MTDEPYSEYGQIIYESGVPLRVNDSGGQGTWARVPQPVAGEEGDVLTVQSDLSVAFAPPAGGGGGNLQMASVLLSNSDLKTPTAVTIVAAQGAGTIIVPHRAGTVSHYGGTNVWTSATSKDFVLAVNGSTIMTTQAANYSHTYSEAAFSQGTTPATTQVSTNWDNKALTVLASSAFLGNAAGDNTITFYVWYWVITL